MDYTPWIIMAVNGLIAGWLAGLLLGGKGIIGAIIVGILGAFVGGALINAGLFTLPYDFNTIVPEYGNQIAVSTVGAILVVLLARLIGR